MSEVYVLVKQIAGRPNGEVTLHGATEEEMVADTWSAGSPENYAPMFNTTEVPDSEKWKHDDETEVPA